MSTSNSNPSSDSTGSMNQKPARRVLASEFNDATEIFQPGDDERAPKYVLLPTGERANRVYFAGTLTEVEDIGNKADFYRGRVVGPTGTFFVYAGQYRPNAMATLKSTDTPEFVSVVGKPRLYNPDEDEDEEAEVDEEVDEDAEDAEPMMQVMMESMTVVGRKTRDTWVVDAAKKTIHRADSFEIDERDDIKYAQEVYGDTVDAYKEDAKQALIDVSDEEFVSNE